MPLFPKSGPTAALAFVADMLAQLEQLVGPRRPFLRYLISMARREAEAALKQHP